MGTINKVLYNVDQTGDTSTTERRTARKNVGFGDVVNQPAVMNGSTLVEWGVAPLDSSGKVPADNLPSYMDDVVEGYYYDGGFYSDSGHTSSITGESGKIYVDLTSGENGASYRWSGSQYIMISWQKAYGKVKVGSTTIEANDIKDTVEIAATDNIAVEGNSSNKKVTVKHSTVGPNQNGDTSKGDTSNQTPPFGGSFKVTSQTVNKFGHTTVLGEHTVTLPSLGTNADTAAAGNHVHGNITNDGKIASDTTVANGHKIVTTDGNGSISRSTVEFSNANTAGNQILTQTGGWTQFIDSSASSSTAAAASDHGHGNITKDGKLESSVAAASNQYLVITEASNNKVARSALKFQSGGNTRILSEEGAWVTFLGTSATTAAAGNHSHGNLENDGVLSGAPATPATDQYLVVTGETSGKIVKSGLYFDTSQTNSILKQSGQWAQFIGTSATTAAAGNHSHNADYGRYFHNTQETFSNANLSITSFTASHTQSSHITRNSSTGVLTLGAGIYNIEYVLYVTVPSSILSNQIGQLAGVEIDYTYEHTVRVAVPAISKCTSSTAFSIDISSSADLLSGTKISVDDLLITYLGGIV